MKSLTIRQALLLPIFSLAASQDVPDPNSDCYKAPSTMIDFPGCFSDLITADRNGDGLIKSDEYLGFIQKYAEDRKCIKNPVLSLQQRIAFNTISCFCRGEEGSNVDCCLGANAEIRTGGALNPTTRTASQQGYLTSACRITDETLGPNECPPSDCGRDRAILPPLPEIFIAPAARSPDDDGGLSKEALWGILAAALLLLILCCCCVCVLRRKKAKEIEEEDEEVIAGKGTPGATDSDPEQSSPTSVLNDSAYLPYFDPSLLALPLGDDEDEGRKRGGGGVNEDEDEEEARKRRGGGPLSAVEEEAAKKRYGGPRLPPPEKEDPQHKLRPVPPKDPEEDPEWDQPGRPMDYPKEKDPMSPGEFEHYDPDGGVYDPRRPGKDPVEFNPQWERGEPEEPDDRDTRKHRIQSGLGEGEVWDQLDTSESTHATVGGGLGDVFDWVIQSALGVLDENATATHLAVDKEP
jgi:hypothetical protein